MRWWIPAAIVALAAMNIVRLQEWTSLDSMAKNMQTFFTGLVTSGLLIVWWLFLTKLRWRTRLAGFGLVVVCMVGLKQLIRIDGSINGGGRPKIVWKWTPRKSGNIAEFKTVPKLSFELERAIEYPGYLGSKRSGVIEGVELDSDWTAHPPQELWRRPIGLGWSAFAVSGSSAITQEQRGECELTVCYDLATGNRMWSHTNLVRFSEPMGGDGPRATPTFNDGKIYALGATGWLNCLDAVTGRKIWDYPTSKSWVIGTPAVRDGVVYVGTSDSARFMALDAKNGRLRFNFDAKAYVFSSAALAGDLAYVGDHNGRLYAVDVKTGKLAWQFQTEASKTDPLKVLKPDGALNQEAFAPVFGDFQDMYIDTWRFISVGAIMSSPAIDHGVLYVGSMDGNLYALQ